MAQRPAHLKPPAYLSQSPPVPEPAPLSPDGVVKRPDGEKRNRLEPTRYGDWEHKGLAVDF